MLADYVMLSRLAKPEWLQESQLQVSPDLSAAVSRRLSHLFAGVLGLMSLMLTVRFMILKHPPLRPVFPIVCYQDVLCCTLLAWLFYGLLAIPLSRYARGLVLAIAWGICVVLAGYTAISAIVYTVLHAPITYHLLLAADGLRGAHASVRASLSSFNLLVIAESFLIFFGVALGLRYLASAFVDRAREIFYSAKCALPLLAYLVLAHLWTVRNVRYLPALQNPELALVSSMFRADRALVTDKIPGQYFAEFESAHCDGPAAIPAHYSYLKASTAGRPYNVVLLIMESVGIRRLQLYKAAYPDTPEMLRLAQHAAVFDRIYVSQAYTSAAMAALFCSLYPQFEWEPITRSNPNVNVPGIADVLRKQGYATAFVHPGTLEFDHEELFLQDHGFQDVMGEADDLSAPNDARLLSQATDWMKSHARKPFFLALWTQDTHHPYFASTSDDYGVADAGLNRYLNAIHSTDQLIGQLARTLASMGMSDNTLLVITGDHGEAFGEHGQTAHNWTVYDEEMRVPLVIVNPQIFPHEQRIDRLGRQIDIAPTILSMLHFSQPFSWEGDSLFSAQPIAHAYLFSRYGNYTFGLVDSRFKYVMDFDRGTAELYDLAADPMERKDISANVEMASTIRNDHLSVEAWILFQEQYLEQFKPGAARMAFSRARGACSSKSFEEATR